MSIKKYKEYLNLNINGIILPEIFLDENNIFNFIKESPHEDVINLYSEMHTTENYKDNIIEDENKNDIIMKFYNSDPLFLKEFYSLMFLNVKDELDYFDKIDYTNFINQLYFYLPDIYKRNKENLFKNNINIDYIHDDILKDYLRNIKRKEKVIKNIIENNGHVYMFRGGDLSAIQKFIATVEKIENITNIDIFGEIKKKKNKEKLEYVGTDYLELFGFMLTLPDLKEHRIFSSEDERKELSLYIGNYFDFIKDKMNKYNIPLKKIISHLQAYRFVSIDEDIINKMIEISSTDKKNYVIPEILKKLESIGDKGSEKYNKIINKVIENEKIQIKNQIQNNITSENKHIKRL